MIGDYEVETVIADEGEGPDTGVPAIQRLLQEDQVDVVVGIVNSATALGAADQFTEAQKLLVVTNAGAGAITGEAVVPLRLAHVVHQRPDRRGHGRSTWPRRASDRST